MSYLRLDNYEAQPGVGLLTADGRYHAGPNRGYLAMSPMNPMNQGPSSMHWYYSQAQAQSQPQAQIQPQARTQTQYRTLTLTSTSMPDIRGIAELIKHIGYPDVTDSTKGGIAIWSNSTLISRGYKFLHRVEIIDESVPSLYPVKHFSNIYIWVKIPLSETMLNNVNHMSSDIFYDRGKELLIVRSDSLDTAVAQASLVALYSKGKISYYDIIGNGMLENYYTSIKKPKVRRALYTVLNNLTKR